MGQWGWSGLRDSCKLGMPATQSDLSPQGLRPHSSGSSLLLTLGKKEPARQALTPPGEHVCARLQTVSILLVTHKPKSLRKGLQLHSKSSFFYITTHLSECVPSNLTYWGTLCSYISIPLHRLSNCHWRVAASLSCTSYMILLSW